MKCISERKAFYNGSIVNVGETFEAAVCPDWAKPIRVKSQKTEAGEKDFENTPIEQGVAENFSEDNPEKKVQENVEFKNDETSEDSQTDDGTTPADDLSGKSLDELNNILDNLINEGIQANILLDGVEAKTPIEQIRELRTLLGYEGEK